MATAHQPPRQIPSFEETARRTRESQQELRALLDRAKAQDADAAPNGKPRSQPSPKHWRTAGDAASHTILAWLDLVAYNDRDFQRSVWQQAEELRDSLLEGDTRPLIVTLVQQYATLWVIEQALQRLAADALSAPSRQSGQMLKLQPQVERQRAAALKELLRIKQLLPAQPAGEQSAATLCASDQDTALQPAPPDAEPWRTIMTPELIEDLEALEQEYRSKEPQDDTARPFGVFGAPGGP